MEERAIRLNLTESGDKTPVKNIGLIKGINLRGLESLQIGLKLRDR